MATATAKRYARIRDSDQQVLDVIMWDGVTAYDPGPGTSLRLAQPGDRPAVSAEDQNAGILEALLDVGADELRRYLALTDAQAAATANVVRVLRFQCRVLLALLRLRSRRLDATD